MATADKRGQVIGLAALIDYADGAVTSKTLLDKMAGTLMLFSLVMQI